MRFLQWGFLCLGLSSCATMETSNDRVNPEMPLWYTRPSGAMNVFIRRNVTAESRKVGEEYERGRAEIDPVHRRVFVGSSDHGLYALRATDGSTIWRFETLSLVQAEPFYDRELDAVYFGSYDGAVYAVRARDGSLIWRFNTGGGEVAKRPALSGDTLFVANASDYLFALDRRTGRQKWQVHRTSALAMEIAGHAGPTVDGDLVYMAYSDGHVVAYNARDGSERWTPVDLTAEAEQARGEAPRYLDADATPIVDTQPGGKVVYVAGYSGGVYALDGQTGARLWANEQAMGVTDLYLWVEPAHQPNRTLRDGPTPPAPVPERKVLIASSGPTGMWGLDPANGRELWRIKLPEGGITAPAAVAGAIVVGTSRYGLFLISPRNGMVMDGITLGSGFAQTPASWGNRAYAMTNGGTLVGIAVEDPRPRQPRL